MANGQYIKGSNGSGEAVRSTVTATRSSGSTVISVDSLANWPTNFIATTGSLNTDNSMTIKLVFRGHIDGLTIVIDSLAPGYTDPGSVIGDVIVLKPSTDWADNLQSFLDVAHDDDGNISDGYITSAKIANATIQTVDLADASVTAQKIDFTGIWWQEIGRTKLVAAGDTISITGLPSRRYLKVMFITINSGTNTNIMRFNNDSTATYNYRISQNGTETSTASASSFYADAGANNVLAELDIVNISNQEKLVVGFTVAGNVAGAANVPGRTSVAGKWANTSSVINRIDIINTNTGDFAIGSELVVLGHD